MKRLLPLLLILTLLLTSCTHILPQIPPSGVDTNMGTTTTDPFDSDTPTAPDGPIYYS